jgi:hypothetical protein
MKKIFLILTVFITLQLKAAVDFDTYFIDKSLRFDYTIGGNSEAANIYFEQLKQEPFWGGSKINLVDTNNLGDFRVLVFNPAGDSILYSRGYSNLFSEWIFTEEAKITYRSFYESVVVPFPKKSIVIKIQMRNKQGLFHDIFTQPVDPTSYFIIKDVPSMYKTTNLSTIGDHHKMLDIVILPEGYTAAEMDKFHKDCKRFTTWFFDVEPFKSNQNKVAFRSVDAASLESGTDVPGSGIWKNTILNSHFYTFGTDRYLTTQDVRTVRDLAAYVPYDQIYILVNSDIYGGGGVFNYYNLCTADNSEAKFVFTHEFGHAFAGLADEYQYGYDKAEDLYDLSVEPWQVNITTLADFASKWKNFVEKSTPIPTPDTEQYKNKVGAFEGAGYVEHKVYRPTHDCKMRSNRTDTFCPVCLKAVSDLLRFYSE